MESQGVSVPFFCGAIKLLSKEYGPRLNGPVIEDFRKALAEAEMFYKSLPLDTETQRELFP